MATTHLIGFLQSGIVTSAGVALASGKVRFYQPGTLTPETVYSDGAGVSPITQPVTLSAGGTATVYSLNPIRCQIKDATDVTLLFDLDQADTVSGSGVSIQSATFNNNVAFTSKAAFDAWSTSFGGTAGMWKGKIGTTERNVKDMISGIAISVLDYGAVGDDATDCTTAIQNTINAVATLGGGIVLFPPGTFRISAALTYGAAGTLPLRIRGTGRGSSTIKQTGAAANGFTFSTFGSLAFESLTITSAAGSTGTAISLPAGVSFSRVFTDVAISGFANGITNLSPTSAIATAVMISCSVDTTAASAGACLTGSFELTTLIGVALNSNIQSATCTNILLIAGGGGAGGSLCGVYSLNGLFGLDIPAAANVQEINLVGCNFASSPIRIAAASAVILRSTLSSVFTTVTDSRTAAPVATALAGNGNVTPRGNVPMRVIQTTPATTVTINDPVALGPAISGNRISLMCLNNSGGAVTWTFAGVFRTSAPVAPATGNGTAIEFLYDHLTGVYREVSRATAAI